MIRFRDNKNKENLPYSELCLPGSAQRENQIKRKERQILDLVREVRKLWNMKVTVIPTAIGSHFERSQRKGNFKRETKSLLIAAQNNAVRTNHIKAGIDKTQQNSKCKRCGDRDETINHIISECSKLAQKKYKTRYDRVVKVIHWEMCKKFKPDHTNK